MLDKSELAAIRKKTGDFYDRPPSLWIKAFWEGEPAAAPKITPTDRCVMRNLYKAAKYDAAADMFSFETSFLEAAKKWGIDRETISASVQALAALGAITVEKKWNRSLIRVKHIRESGGKWEIF